MKPTKTNPSLKKSRVLKRGLYLTSFIVCALFSFILIQNYREKLEREEEAFEEHEGIPGVLKQFDLWSDMRTYPNPTLDATAFNSSYKLSKAMLESQKNDPNARISVMATLPWSNLGPMNFSGRILSIGFHPTDPNIMWVGSASGGIWKTTNGGSGAANGINWTYVPTGFPALGVSSIAVNPTDGNEIYAGTGEVYNANPGGSTGAGHVRLFRGSYGIGILKSTDGGTTWTKSLDFATTSIKGVSDILIHPTNPDTVFAATTDGIYRTFNGGGSWSLIHNVTFAMDLVFKPGNPNVLYAGVGNFQSANNGIYKTTNANATTPTFTKLTSAAFPNPISGKINLAISAANPTRIYASIGRDPDQTAHVQGLYISTNEGTTWAAAAAASILGNQGWYAHDVAVSPTDANEVLWGELDTYRSINGGTSFTKTGSWNLWDVNNTTVGDLTEGQTNTTGYVHADVHRIEPSPHDATGNTFFLCTDGGLFRSTNGGANFNTLNGGLNTAQIYANMAQHPTNANYMLLGLQDNEAAIYEGNAGCRRIGNLGDGFHATMNSTGTVQIVESYYFNRRTSTNSGGTWGAGSLAVPASENACFNVPMVYSRTPSSTYFFGGTNIFKRSANSGTTWTNPAGTTPVAGSLCPAIAMVAPSNNIVYFSTAPGGGVRSKLWKTTNAAAATPTFTEITGTLPDRYYSGIDVDPTNTNRIFVTLSGFGSSHVYMSLNGGTTWSDIGGGLPDVPHNTVFVNPTSPTQIYIGNDLGVYIANAVPTTGVLGATTNLNWYNFSEGLGDAVMASHIAITHTGKLRLGTYGRGLWERDLASLTLPVTFKYLKGFSVERGNELQWGISEQSNVNHYEVEYAANATDFVKVGSVKAVMASGDQTYKFIHSVSNLNDAFYRIKIVDNDGKYSYSSVALVKAQKLITKLKVFPNPAVTNFQITVPTTVNEQSELKVYSMSGALVLTERRSLRNGTNNLSVDVRSLAAGNYQIVVETASRRWTATLVKQ